MIFRGEKKKEFFETTSKNFSRQRIEFSGNLLKRDTKNKNLFLIVKKKVEYNNRFLEFSR